MSAGVAVTQGLDGAGGGGFTVNVLFLFLKL